MAINLTVPFINQLNQTPPDAFDGQGAGGPTSCVMLLAAYGMLDAHPSSYGWYVANPYTNRLGVAFTATQKVWPAYTYNAAGAYGFCIRDGEAQAGLMANYFAKHGLEARSANSSAEAVAAQIRAGKPVVLGTHIAGIGHLIVVKGLTDDNRFICNDPARTADKIYSWADFNGSGYMLVMDRAIDDNLVFSTKTVEKDKPKPPAGTEVNYQIAILENGVRVRSGANTSSAILTQLSGNPTRLYKVSKAVHGENIKSNKQPSGWDDVWCFIPELNGYVTRAYANKVN